MEGIALTFPLLICDMGSSSGKWVIFHSPDDVFERLTIGISPIHTPEIEAMEVLKSLSEAIPGEPAMIHYYGTGCYHLEPRMKMYDWIINTFPAARLQIRSDLESAALSTLGNKDGWIAILGTGSSLARWENGVLTLSPSTLDVMNDAGSGTAIGNMLLQSYFYRDLPQELRNELVKAHPEITELEPGQIQSQHPDRITARYAQWAIENASHFTYLEEMIKKALSEFIEKRIMPCYEQYGGAVHFNGSVAWHTRRWLLELLQEHGIAAGEITASPLEGLIRYYKEEMTYGQRH